VQVSNAYKLPNKTNKFKILGKSSDGIILRLYGTEDVVDIFDESLRLTGTKTIDFKNQTGLSQYIMLNKTGAVIFYLSQDKKFSVLYAQPVNSKFIEIGKPLVIDTIYDKRDLVASNIRFKPSIDQSYLMIYYPYFSANKLESVKFICLDRGLQQLYNKTYPFNRDEKELEESKALIDNRGNSFLVLKPEAGSNGDNFNVYRVDSTGDFSFFSIATEKALFGEPAFDFDNKNGDLLMCGFYNDDRKAEEVAHGFLFARYDPIKGTAIKADYMPFNKAFITELTSRESNEKPRLYTFVIRKVILRNDGGVVINAESFIKDTRETPLAVGYQGSYSNYRTSSVFQFNDIISFSITPKGEVDWHSVLRKKQASEDDNGVYSSFLTMNEKESLRFLYLDDITSSASLNEYTLNSEGKSTRNLLLSQEDKDVMLLPKIGKQVSPNEVILPSYMNGMLKLVKITF
jgi:hypothetical protein